MKRLQPVPSSELQAYYFCDSSELILKAKGTTEVSASKIQFMLLKSSQPLRFELIGERSESGNGEEVEQIIQCFHAERDEVGNQVFITDASGLNAVDVKYVWGNTTPNPRFVSASDVESQELLKRNPRASYVPRKIDLKIESLNNRFLVVADMRELFCSRARISFDETEVKQITTTRSRDWQIWELEVLINKSVNVTAVYGNGLIDHIDNYTIQIARPAE